MRNTIPLNPFQDVVKFPFADQECIVLWQKSIIGLQEVQGRIVCRFYDEKVKEREGRRQAKDPRYEIS